jgi:hypothetical protein
MSRAVTERAMRSMCVSSLIAAICLVGSAGAAANAPSGQGGPILVPRADRPAPVMLAGMLLLDDSILPDEDQTGEVTTGEDAKKAQQDRSPATRPTGTTTLQQVGGVSNAQVSGQVRSRALADNLRQSQEARRSRQAVGVGSVSDATVTGTFKVKAKLEGSNQHQGGESNNQGMSVGGVR